MVPHPSGRARGLQSLVEKTLGTTVSAETSKAVVEIVNFISNQILDVAKSSALQDAGVSEAELDSKDEATRDKKIKFLRSFIAELSTKASTLTVDLAKAKRELDASRKTRDKAAARVKKLEDQRSDLLKSIDDLEQRRTTLQQTLRNEINTLQKKISDLRTMLALKMAELDRLIKIYKDPNNNCKNLGIPAIASELSKPRVSLNGNQKPVMHMAVSGSLQTSYTLERSTDLHQWQSVTSITLVDLGDGEFTIDIAEANNMVFFRSQSAR